MAKQTFTTGQVLTAAQMTSLQQTAMGGGSATAKTASYVLVAADAGTTVIMNSASATTITVNTALFAAGDTVAIINQGAGVCTITAGTATVSTAASLAMAQNETGELYFLSTSAAIFTENMQTAGGGGKVLQVVQGTTTTSTTISSTTYTDTALSASITPTSATSKILVMVAQKYFLYRTAAGSDASLQIIRGATSIVDFGARSAHLYATPVSSELQIGSIWAPLFLDSPATTSSTTYKTQAKTADTGSGHAITLQLYSNTSVMILMEIGA